MKKLLLIFFLFGPSLYAQDFSISKTNFGFSIIPGINYISSGSIQMNPFSSNEIERNITEELYGGYGYGITFKKNLFREDLAFGVSTEYLYIEDNEVTQTLTEDSSRVRLRVTEKIWLYPVEFTGYFNLPTFAEKLNIYLGGGVGVYFGNRKRSILNMETETESTEPGFNFIILSGIEYFVTDRLSGIFELRFREGEFTAKSSFPASTVTVNNKVYRIEKNLNSRIFVDGLKLSFCVGYYF